MASVERGVALVALPAAADESPPDDQDGFPEPAVILLILLASGLVLLAVLGAEQMRHGFHLSLAVLAATIAGNRPAVKRPGAPWRAKRRRER